MRRRRVGFTSSALGLLFSMEGQGEEARPEPEPEDLVPLCVHRARKIETPSALPGLDIRTATRARS